jgi:hypothetical protein
MRRLPRHLRHPDGILKGIEAVEGRRVAVELVAENEDEHREHEQVQVREKSREATVSMHVPN